jgi:hypothetical protein
MNRSLGRLLRIRELVEDRARQDLERKNAEMQALEESAVRQQQLARQVRRDALQDLSGVESRAEEWRLKIDDAEVTESRVARLGALAHASKPIVDQAREEWMVRRREKRQVEMLHAAAVQKEEKRQIRKDQNRTDDWFQSRSRRGR